MTLPSARCHIHSVFAYYSPMGKRKVYLYYMCNRGWECQFLEADLKTPVGRRMTFADPQKVIELAERGGAFKDLASRQAMDYGINMGRGSAWLWLTDEQYAKLKKR